LDCEALDRPARCRIEPERRCLADIRTVIACSLPGMACIRPAAMQNEIAELPARPRVHALPATGFLFQLSHQAGLNIGR